MAITPSDFSKIWASNADTPEYTFTEANYLKGWDFVGNLPPTRAMWNAIQKRTDEKMKYVFNNFGAPLTASTVADMTMQNRVYVYTGNETGYTAGHWYYWNGSAWTDGGVYNSNTVQVDPTLTISGAAADAKVAGNIFDNITIDESTDDTFDSVESGTVYNTSSPGGTAYANGQSFIKTVVAGDKFLLTTTILSSTSYYAVLFYHNTTYISGGYQGTSTQTPVTDYEFIVPSGVNKIIVSTLKTVTPKIKKVVSTIDFSPVVSMINDVADITITNGTTYTNVVAESTETGYKAYKADNGRLVKSADASMGFKVYKVLKGGKYKLYGFGYDRSSFYVASTALTNIIADGVSSTDGLENVLCGTDAYPAGFTYHTIIFEPSVDCYLYVNYRLNDATATNSVADKEVATATEVQQAIGLVQNRGVVVDGNKYSHFLKVGNKYIIREFTHRGPNNLFQWSALKIGTINDGIITIETTIADFGTDVVGPISIYNSTLFPGQGGMWSGGYHSVNVAGVACPTAIEEDFSCYVNGYEITEDGLYYGDVVFTTENKLYFPQSVTGVDLSTATEAIKEYRQYRIGEQIDVMVRLQFLNDVSVVRYYGMQGVFIGFENVFVCNNEYYHLLNNAEAVYFNVPERKIIFSNSGRLHMDMELYNVGLGEYKYCNESDGFVYLPQQATNPVRKIYYWLIDNSRFNADSNVMWEGRYSVYYA